MRDLGVNDLKDFVCLTSQVECNSKCDDCSECENEIDKLLAEHDEQIRADERRKFAEWLCKKSHYRCIEDLGFRTNIFDISNIYSIEAVLSEYEREQANE